MKRLIVQAIIASSLVKSVSAHEIGPFTPEQAEEALYKATAFDRHVPECASIRERTPKRERACREAQEAVRDGFQLDVEACNEGGQLAVINVPVPASYVCTVSVRPTETTPRRGGIVIFYFANDEWNAYVP